MQWNKTYGGAGSYTDAVSVVQTADLGFAFAGDLWVFDENDSDFRLVKIARETCEVSPMELDFGTVTVGGYLDRSFTITNTGGEVPIGSVSESCAHYSIVSGGGAYNLPPDGSVVVTVRFEPGSVGQRNCTIETGNELCSDVFCSGQGWQDGEPIPTVSEWGMLAMVLLSLTAGTLVIRRQEAAMLKPRG